MKIIFYKQWYRNDPFEFIPMLSINYCFRYRYGDTYFAWGKFKIGIHFHA